MQPENCLFIENTERCSKKRKPLSNFCVQHQTPFPDIDNPTLLEMTLKRMGESIYINDQKKVAMYSPLESPEKRENAASLTNCLNTLIERGYSMDEVLRTLDSLTQGSSLFDDLRQKAGNTDPKWKRFEKLIAGIHILRADGAKVTFDDHVIGKRTGSTRQIDVSLRFSNSYYDYLAAVECKDYEVPIGEVEAFHTKLKDIGARLGILVSSKGFQQGAKAAAEACGIELFTLTEEFSDWTKTVREHVMSIPFPEEVTFDHPTIPGGFQAQQLTFGQVALYKDEKSSPIKLSSIICDVCGWAHERNLALPSLVNLRFTHTLYTQFPGTEFYTPIYGLQIKLKRFEWKASRTIDIPPQREKYVYADVAKKKSFEIPPEEIPIGVDTILTPGKFYTDRRGTKYRCIEVNDNKVTMMLLESKQNGETVDAEFEADLSFAYEVVPFTDSATIEHLEKRYRFSKQQKTPKM